MVVFANLFLTIEYLPKRMFVQASITELLNVKISVDRTQSTVFQLPLSYL